MAGHHQPPNNLSERLLHGIAINRKNLKFVGSHREATFDTLIKLPKVYGMDPEAYIARVIDRIAKGEAFKQPNTLLP